MRQQRRFTLVQIMIILVIIGILIVWLLPKLIEMLNPKAPREGALKLNKGVAWQNPHLYELIGIGIARINSISFSTQTRFHLTI